jgi:hypothetical protein
MANIEAAELKVPPYQIRKYKRAKITDVPKVVDCGSAAVHTNLLPRRVQRHELLNGTP